MIRSIPSRRSTRAGSARLGDTGDSSFGCLSWPACVAGGTLCADPQSFGASLNPCCHFAPPAGDCPDNAPPTPSSSGSYGVLPAFSDTATQAAADLTKVVVPSWVWIALLSVGGFVLFEVRK
jgi:hypothetical protein